MTQVGRGTGAACEFDHLIVGAHTLEQGAAFVEDLLGVAPQAGGRHLVMGTHNRVLRLGVRAYLEIIAIDPAGEAPSRPRWFGLDDEKLRARLREGPRLLTWAARTTNIDAALEHAQKTPGVIHPMSRGDYTWRITIPDDGALIGGGLMPALIQWDCAAHPADKLEDRGCEFLKISGHHPAAAEIAATLAALGLAQTVTLAPAGEARMSATIRGPRGIRVITS